MLYAFQKLESYQTFFCFGMKVETIFAQSLIFSEVKTCSDNGRYLTYLILLLAVMT